MFNWKKPTVQMLGRWQPWHDGHQELLKDVFQKQGKLLFKSGMFQVPLVEKTKTTIHLIGIKFA